MHPAWYINGFFAWLMQGLLFWRGLRCGLYRRYSLFYIYLLYSTLWSVMSGMPMVIRQPAYRTVVWTSQLLAALLRFGVVAEIYRHVFPRDSSLRKTTDTILVTVLMLMAVVLWVVGPSAGSSRMLLDSLRKIVLSQVVWTVLVLGLARYYAIRIGGNIWGMSIGLLLFSGSELVYLSCVDLFPSLRSSWFNVHPIAYVCTLLVWTYALWNHSPNPETVPLEETTRHNLLSTWEDHSKAVASTLRRVTKP